MPAIDYLKAIRRKCLDCSGGVKAEVEKCPACHCPLYPYRQGNPQGSLPLEKTGGGHERH
ncbi:MAG: hypothetical protein HDQ88_03540 [Clostridia bacterium]|nr:hypothetical protein [Clostridia bacterium]